MGLSWKTIKQNKLFTSAAIFTAANIIDKGLPFLILPILARAMPPAEYALVALFTGIVVITNFTVGLSASGYLGVAYFKDGPEEFASLLWNAFLVFIVSFVLNAGVFLGAPDFFGHYTGLPFNAMMLTLLASLGLGLHSMILSLMRARHQAAGYAFFQLMRSFLDIGLSLFFVLSLHWSWEGRVLGITMANLIMGAVGMIVLYRIGPIHFHFRQDHIKQILFFGIPLLPHALGNWALSVSDRFFINTFVGADANGKYSLGFTLGMAIAVLTQSFNQAWAPHLFDVLKKNEAAEKIKVVKFTYAYFVGILFVALGFALVARVILKMFFPPQYFQAAEYILPISISYAFDGMYLMVTNYIFYSGKTYLVSLGTGIVAVVKLSLSYYLIKHLGVIGAIYSSLISFGLMFMLTFIIASRVQKMPWLDVFRKSDS